MFLVHALAGVDLCQAADLVRGVQPALAITLACRVITVGAVPSRSRFLLIVSTFTLGRFARAEIGYRCCDGSG